MITRHSRPVGITMAEQVGSYRATARAIEVRQDAVEFPTRHRGTMQQQHGGTVFGARQPEVAATVAKVREVE